MTVLWAILTALVPILKEILPLLVRWMVQRDKDALDRARELQASQAETARLMRKGKTDELSRKENFKLLVVDQLLRNRSLRKRSKPIE